MKKKHIVSEFEIYESLDELTPQIQNLMQQAIIARKKAYAPYSLFQVGAAVLLDNELVVVGSNQENAVYPLGLCAERVAVFQAGALYPDSKILKIAITGTSNAVKSKSPVPPCGSCRQAIAEYETRQKKAIEIYFMGELGPIYKSNSVENLLPLLFNKEFL